MAHRLIFKIITIAVTALLIVAPVDFYIASKANIELLSNNDIFDDAIREADLDFDGTRKQSCFVKTIYILYRYQTCFILWKDTKDPSKSFFQLIYHRPVAIVKFYGKSEDSLYFSEPTLGRKIGDIFNTGSQNTTQGVDSND